MMERHTCWYYAVMTMEEEETNSSFYFYFCCAVVPPPLPYCMSFPPIATWMSYTAVLVQDVVRLFRLLTTLYTNILPVDE